MPLIKNASQIASELEVIITKLAANERARLVQERKFLESVKASSYGASTATKNAQADKALEDIKKFIGVST